MEVKVDGDEWGWKQSLRGQLGMGVISVPVQVSNRQAHRPTQPGRPSVVDTVTVDCSMRQKQEIATLDVGKTWNARSWKRRLEIHYKLPRNKLFEERNCLKHVGMKLNCADHMASSGIQWVFNPPPLHHHHSEWLKTSVDSG